MTLLPFAAVSLPFGVLFRGSAVSIVASEFAPALLSMPMSLFPLLLSACGRSRDRSGSRSRGRS
jgi:hypothetical protein